jgi:dTDP-4-amino-4,6-dideoxygalactose transaminase
MSIPEHPIYQQMFGWQPEDYPNASYIGRHTVSLPISAKLTDADVEDVIAAVKKCLALDQTKIPVLAAAAA